MEVFIKRFKELRKEKSISLNELAEALGVDKSTICRWENGEQKPGFDAIIAISKFFHVSSDYILGLTDFI